MKHSARLAGIIWLALLFLLPFAQADDHLEDDLGLWIPVTLELPITEKLSTSLQVEPRLNNNLRSLGQIEVVPSMSYRLNDHLTLQGGYGWTPAIQPRYRDERRIMTQVVWRRNFQHLNLLLRNRVEERFFEDVNGTAVRNCSLVRLEIPIRQTPYYGVTYDDVFINLNTVDKGPKAGFDQNRFFAGIGRHLGERATAELGYQLQTVRLPREAPNLMNHVILMRLTYRLR